MTYDPDIHRRRSIRLKDYDYSQAGAYFVTICTQNKECVFGDVVGGEMRLNDAGFMIAGWRNKIPTKFAQVETDQQIIMPNHFHGIISIVGAAPCRCPAIKGNRPSKNADNIINTNTRYKTGQPHGVAPTLGDVMDWFKTMTTNEYIAGVNQKGWSRFAGKLWQRNYYEHIIRNEVELNRIREYIINNLVNWETDENYKA